MTGESHPLPAARTVEVWAIEVRQLAGTTTLARLLSPEERARAARLVDATAQRLYVASHALTRAVIAPRIGLDPGEVAFTRRCERCGHPKHGRPRLEPPFPGRPVEFSLARTAGLVVVAVSPDRVGVDVERLDNRLSPTILAKVLSPAETAELGKADAPLSRRSSYEAWVSKEALGKVRGSGLVGVRRLEVLGPGPGAWRVVSDGPCQWQVRLLDFGPGHAGALATAPGPTALRFNQMPINLGRSPILVSLDKVPRHASSPLAFYEPVRR